MIIKDHPFSENNWGGIDYRFKRAAQKLNLKFIPYNENRVFVNKKVKNYLFLDAEEEYFLYIFAKKIEKDLSNADVLNQERKYQAYQARIDLFERVEC
jgi:hypothetical protein